MATTEIDQFAKNLLKSRLLDRDAIQDAYRKFSASGDLSNKNSSENVEAFARYLIDEKLLTEYQAKRILAGRTEGFFLGGCRILDRLGKGGMGVVYLAQQERLDRKVALKVLPFQGKSESPVIKRFYREARAAAKLKHSNIVQVFDVDAKGNTHFIVMELVDGKNLYEIVKRNGPLPVGQSLLLIKQAAEGLQHAHDHGIIHRDIKPSNLVLEGDQLKVLDLGLARLESDEQLTNDTDIMGTLDYMSPEQFSGAVNVDHRSDIYSLGCTWFQLLTGKAPFGDRLPAGKMSGHVSESVPLPSEANANVPDSVSNFILRMTAKNLESRYQSMSELIADLESVESVWQEQTIVGSAPKLASTSSSDQSDTHEVQDDQPTIDSGDGNLELSDQSSDYETAVHAPEDRVWSISLAYLISVMMTLVLGGVYVGIQVIKDKLANTETIVVNVPGMKSEQESNSNLNNGVKTTLDQKVKTELSQAHEKSDDLPDDQSTPVSDTNDTDQTKEEKKTAVAAASQPETMQEQEAAEVEVEREPRETVLRRFETDWDDDLVDGDVLTLVSKNPYHLEAPIKLENRLTIQGTEASHAIVVFSIPADSVGWTLQQAQLNLKFVDLYVDLHESTLAAVEVFKLDRANLSLSDSSVTLLPSSATNWEGTTLFSLKGANEWDPSAKGDPPAPLSIQLDRVFIRGQMTLLQNRSTQSQLTTRDCLIATSGPLVHAYHQEGRQFAHQEMEIRVETSTIDSEQPLLRIDCRPFDLRPVPMKVSIRESIISALGAVANQPPLIFWSSPIDRFSIPDSLTMTGQGNVYLRRQFGLITKSSTGDALTLVQSPADWSRQLLGEDAGSEFADLRPKTRWSDWQDRHPRDYDNRLLLKSVHNKKDTDIGVKGIKLKTPRRL